MNLAIDTNILVQAFCKWEPVHTVVTSFVTQKLHNLCFDSEGCISKEYERNVGKSDAHRKWYKRITAVKALYYCSGKLNQTHKTQLCQLGCHESTDHAFIAVAFNSDKHLISEDSDVGKGPKGNQPPHCNALKYLNDEMGITVYDAQEASLNLGNKS